MSSTSSKSKKNGGGKSYVTAAQCQATHRDVTNQISNLQTSVNQIVNTLLGEQKPGSLERGQGLVKDIQDIRSGMKSRWTSKERTTILASLITAIAAIIVAIFR